MKNRIFQKLSRFILPLASLSFLVTPSLSAKDYNRSDFNKDMSSLIEKHQNAGTSGALLIAKGGKVIETQYFGYQDMARSQTISTNTVFDTGSLTKQFTAAAILKLTEEGKMQVTDTVGKYFSQAPEDKTRITIHQLLTHSAGLQDFPDKRDFDLVKTPRFFSKILMLPTHFEPGTQYRYSNAGYSLLARVIELVSGMEYEQYMHTHFFKPLGMFNTGYRMPDWQSLPHAEGYTENNEFGTAVSRYHDMADVSWVLKGNGGINSTLGDFHLWMKSLRNHEILSKASISLMTDAHIAEDESEQSHYGYGWVNIKTPRNTQLITHNGSNMVFFADTLWLKDEDAWVIFFSNTYSENIKSVAWYAEAYLSKWLND